jgi:hypothetical protein
LRNQRGRQGFNLTRFWYDCQPAMPSGSSVAYENDLDPAPDCTRVSDPINVRIACRIATGRSPQTAATRSRSLSNTVASGLLEPAFRSAFAARHPWQKSQVQVSSAVAVNSPTGCRAAATLGLRQYAMRKPQRGFGAASPHYATPAGLMPRYVNVTLGSCCAATQGYLPQALRAKKRHTACA